MLRNLYETRSSHWVLINKCSIGICWSVYTHNVTEITSDFCMTCCFHIQSTRNKMTVLRGMTPYALVHTSILGKGVTLVFIVPWWVKVIAGSDAVWLIGGDEWAFRWKFCLRLQGTTLSNSNLIRYCPSLPWRHKPNGYGWTVSVRPKFVNLRTVGQKFVAFSVICSI